MNELTFELKLNYVNENGEKVSISRKVCEDGLEISRVQVGDVCITEETICGRVLSGRIDGVENPGGYRYNYGVGAGELLENLNKEVPIGTAVNQINKTKMTREFLSAKMFFISISRDDYRVYQENKGDLEMVKIVTSKSEDLKEYCFQERTFISKAQGGKSFVEKGKERSLKIDGDYVLLGAQETRNEPYNEELEKLMEISRNSPHDYKDLLTLKNYMNMPMSSMD